MSNELLAFIMNILTFLGWFAAMSIAAMHYLFIRGTPHASGWNWVLAGLVCVVIAEGTRMIWDPSNWISWLLYLIGILLLALGLAVTYRDEIKRDRVRKIRQKDAEIVRETQSLVDPVTRLPNRRQFDARMFAELRRLRPLRRSISLLLLTIDDFKALTESYGQEGINTAAQHMAWVIQSSIRGQDIPARLSPDGFALILPGAGGQEAAIVAERIRKKTENNPAKRKEQLIFLTCSIGIVSTTEDDLPANAEPLLQIAEEALKQAHAGGRNRVSLGPLYHS